MSRELWSCLEVVVVVLCLSVLRGCGGVTEGEHPINGTPINRALY